MRALEVHIIETASDIDLAIKAGLLEPTQLNAVNCSDCEEEVGHTGGVEEFEPFAVVIDADDADWVVCIDCASPITDGDIRLTMFTEPHELLTTPKKPALLLNDYLDEDDLDEF